MTGRIGQTIAGDIVDQLRDQIRTGKLKPGEFLRQNLIAEQFGVSSTPVREALAILEREGLVRRELNRGVAVFSPTADDLINCFEIREALEVLAAKKAAQNLKQEDLDHLADLANRMSKTTDLDEYLHLNQDFHERIERAACCNRLVELISAQRAAATTYLAFLGLSPATSEETTEEHQMIVEALATGIPSVAANAMSHHLRTRAEVLRVRLRRLKEVNEAQNTETSK